MKDDTAKTKKPLPRRSEKLIDNSTKQAIQKLPTLPEYNEGQRPCFLLIDDDAEFMGALSKQWSVYYAKSFNLFIFNTREHDPDNVTAWINQRLENLESKKRLDAIFIDKHLAEGGQSTLDYLRTFRNNPKTRYLPIAVITTHEFGDDSTERREFLQYAEWMMFNKRATPGFLYHMATSLPSAKESVADRMWSDLISHITTWITQHKIDEDKVESELFNELNRFFQDYFNLCTYFIGRKENDVLKISQAESKSATTKHFPDILKHQDLPFLTELSEQPSNFASLNTEHIGILKILKEKPFLGCRLIYADRDLGVIALFNHPGNEPFRKKDSDFLRHLALQLSHFLGWRTQRQRDRRRQELLIQFADKAASSNDLDSILSELVKTLHAEVNNDDDHHAKTTLRKLMQASGKIIRFDCLGLESKGTPLTLDSKNSLYAESLRERTPLRYGNLEQEENLRQKQERSNDIHSSLTVPILSGSHVFGGVNLEHQTADYYNNNDEFFVKTLCDLTAAAWMRLKQFSFQQQLIGLLQSLWHDETFESLQQRIYQNLQRFTGFASLFYLVRNTKSPTGWYIEQVVDVDTTNPSDNIIRDMPKLIAAQWIEQITLNWDDTFIGKVLSCPNPEFRYIEGDEAGTYRLKYFEASGEQLIIYSEAVIPIPAQDQRNSAIVLFFRLDKNLTQEQQVLLKAFGQVIGDILHHIDQVKSLAERLKTAQAQAELGFLYGQMRHVLNNQLGGVKNILNELEDDGAEAAKFKLIRDTLSSVDRHLESMRYLIADPIPEDVDLSILWLKLQTDFDNNTNYPVQLTVGELMFTHYRTDPKSLSAILYNLILNAGQACKKAAQKQKSCAVTLSSHIENGLYHLRIQDNGPGVSSELLERIFDKSYTTRSDGTGFGLFFCRFQAERLGATLTAENTEAGACFILTWQEQTV